MGLGLVQSAGGLLGGQVALWNVPPTGPRREFEVRNFAGDKPHMRGLFIWNETDR